MRLYIEFLDTTTACRDMLIGLLFVGRRIQMPSIPEPPPDPNADTEARHAIWKAICLAAEQLAHSCSVYTPATLGGARHKVDSQQIPDVDIWQLVEGLSLLCILLRADSVRATDVTLFIKGGPFEFVEDGVSRYLWFQHSLEGQHSGLGSRPDLFVTSTSNAPDAGNVLRVVEVKSARQLDTQTVRAESREVRKLGPCGYAAWR
jgi:hypothetical protein